MDFIIDKFTFLGLNEREVKVFTALATFGRMNITKIANRSNLPRTTVDAIVRRLLAQGLIFKEKVRGHYEYEVKTQEVANTLEWIEQRFRTSENENIQAKVSIQNDEKIVTETKCIDNLSDIATMYKGDRVRLLLSRGFEEMDVCVERFKGYVDIAFTHDLKMETLLPASIADALKKETWHTPASSLKNVRLTVVPTSYSTATFDMLFFHDCIVLVHTSKKEVEHVTQANIITSCKHLMEIASETGWCIDLSAWLNGEHN